MAWLSVPELADSSLDSESSGPDFAPSVMLSGKATQRPLSWRGWKTRPWIRLLYGTISAPSTASRGAERWIASLAESRVLHSAQPGSKEDSKTNAGLGTISSGWSMKFDPESSFWRTSQASLFTDSPASSEDWKILSRAGGVASGCAYPRAVWVPLTEGKDSSDFSWPTPRAVQPPESVENWEKRRAKYAAQGQDLQKNLEVEAMRWPTPTSRDWKDGACENQDVPSNALLGRVAVRWPTPTSQDAAGSGSAGYSTASGRSEGVTLTDATVRASRLGLPTVSAGESGSPQEAPRQRLNPAFVEALMGLPPGWSLPTIGSGASGMRLYLSRQRRLLASLLGG